MLELKRPFHFQITGGSSVRKRVIIEEIDLVKTATEMLGTLTSTRTNHPDAFLYLARLHLLVL